MKLSIKVFGCVLFFCLINLAAPAISQNTFPFKCKVVHNKKGLLKRFSVLVNGQQAVTNDAGVFLIALNSSVTYVKIDMESNRFAVLYPTAGHVFIPKDPNAIQEIIVGNPGDNSLLKEYSKLVESTENQKDANIKNFLNLKIDSLRRQLLELNYTQNDLEESRRLMEARRENKVNILTTLDKFANRGKDLLISFGLGTQYAFDNKEAIVKLQTQVTDYTSAWDELSKKRNEYEDLVDQYWTNDSTSADFRDLTSFALDTLHGDMLKLNASIKGILEYRNDPKKDKNKKAQVQADIDSKLSKIDPEIAELKNRTEKLRNELN